MRSCWVGACHVAAVVSSACWRLLQARLQADVQALLLRPSLTVLYCWGVGRLLGMFLNLSTFSHCWCRGRADGEGTQIPSTFHKEVQGRRRQIQADYKSFPCRACHAPCCSSPCTVFAHGQIMLPET